MRLWFAVPLLTVAVSGFASSSDLPPPEALSCTVATAVCDDVVTGELGVTDCTLDDGTYVDTYELDGILNQVIGVRVRPLSPLYRDPTVTITPPAGNASKTPVTSGGAAGTVWFRMTSTGKWTIEVGSTDLFSSGAYALETDCQTLPGTRQCFDQEILCGQTQRWDLTSQSCRYIDEPDRLFQYYQLYGVAGDVLRLKMVSASLPPRILIYDLRAGIAPLQKSVSVGDDTAELTFTAPYTGVFGIAATSTEDRAVGPYTLTVNCAVSGCLRPSILEQPYELEVAYGESVELELDVHQIGPVEYLWYEFGDFPRLLATTGVPHWKTGPMTAAHSYLFVTASSPCGFQSSETIHIAVKSDRRRATRH